MEACIRCNGVLNTVIQGRSFALQSDGDVMIYPSNWSRAEAYNGEFTVEEKNPVIDLTVVVPKDVYVRDLIELCNVPIVIELCDGRTFSAEGASNISGESFDAKTNILTMQFIAPEIVELLPTAEAA